MFFVAALHPDFLFSRALYFLFPGGEIMNRRGARARASGWNASIWGGMGWDGMGWGAVG